VSKSGLHRPTRFLVDHPLNSDDDTAARLDKWLWAVRLFKTRSLAAAACRAGTVTLSDRPTKPARDVKPGDTLVVQQGVVRRTVIVRAVPASRVGAPLVAEYCTETTAPEEWEKAKALRVQHLLARDRGTGRPTKRERRQLESWIDAKPTDEVP
jgi:ribosome-associated heat shock protein Hsp15